MKKMNLHASEQSGFTLIELIMVIVILGILSAFALPKFADLSGSANKATVQGALGAVKSGAAIAHAQWLASGSSGSTVVLEGSTVSIINGYPDKTDLGDLADLTEFTITPGVTATADPTIISAGTAENDPCFTYEDAAASGAPTISIVGALNAAGDACT